MQHGNSLSNNVGRLRYVPEVLLDGVEFLPAASWKQPGSITARIMWLQESLTN
jgi:hypothetical protein